MGQLNNENLEHSDIEAFREAIIGNGVITGLEVTQSSTPAMTVAVSAGQCTIDAVVYTEGSAQNLNISNGDATHPRKDIVVYDATAGNPAVVAGTPAAAPVPPDIPSGDILLGIVLVVANESTSILNADITNDRVYSIKRSPHTSVSANTTLNDAHYVVTVDATGGARTITLPTSIGIKGKVYVIKKIDSSSNAVVVDPNGAETIDGSSTKSLGAQWASMVLQSDGANWINLVNIHHKTTHMSTGADPLQTTISASNDVLHTNATERYKIGNSYTKVKDTQLSLINGIARVKCSLKSQSASYMAYYLIYVNGVSVVPSHSTLSTSYVEFSDDIPVGCGDCISIYIRTNHTSVYAYVRDLKICGALSDDQFTSRDP